MDNKHGKLFVIKQSKGCKFMPKMRQNRPTFSGRAMPGPTGGAHAVIAAMGELLGQLSLASLRGR